MSDLGRASLVAISEWIDSSPAYAGISAEAADWRRIGKVGEEFGEVVEAFLGSLGENPRKGHTNGIDKVVYELLDVASCALGAYEHLTGNAGIALDRLDQHLVSVGVRAGVVR